MSVKHSTVTVGTSATTLVAGVTDDDHAAIGVGRRSIRIENGATPIVIGGPDVTATSYGATVAAGGIIELDLEVGDEPFAITASGSSTVHVLHLGV